MANRGERCLRWVVVAKKGNEWLSRRWVGKRGMAMAGKLGGWMAKQGLCG